MQSAKLPLNLNITVSEHQGKTKVMARGHAGTLTEITMNLTPEAANQVYRNLFAQMVPVMAWRHHPLYQWGQRKIGK